MYVCAYVCMYVCMYVRAKLMFPPFLEKLVGGERSEGEEVDHYFPTSLSAINTHIFNIRTSILIFLKMQYSDIAYSNT